MNLNRDATVGYRGREQARGDSYSVVGLARHQTKALFASFL